MFVVIFITFYYTFITVVTYSHSYHCKSRIPPQVTASHSYHTHTQVHIHSAGSSGKGAPQTALVEDNGDGTYRAKYTINVTGQYDIHVRYAGLFLTWVCFVVGGCVLYREEAYACMCMYL